MILESYINCYIECPFYHYLNYCTINNKCENEYNKLILDKKECVKNCSLDDEYKFQKQCFKQCPENTEISKNKEFYCEVICDEEKPFERVEYQECVERCDINEMQLKKCITKYISNNTSSEDKLNDKKMESIENSFTDENYNTSNLENGQNEVIKDEKFTITLTTTENQKANKDSNMTTIDLGPCEKLLKEHYKMKQEDILYMKQIEVYQEGMKIPKIEYDVYAKLNGSNLVKLNLTVCKDTKIDISIPIVISENLDKLNASSGYYNDICYKSKSNSDTDIILKDRKEEFIKGNKTICQDGCDFSFYDNINKKAQCSCNIKESSNNYADMIIDKKQLFKNFIDIKNIANINLLKCYKSLFSKKCFERNIGNFTTISIIIFHNICIFIFYINQLNKIKDKINDISLGIKNFKPFNENEKKYKRKNNFKNN